jgi:hypothetical protein
MDALSTTDGTFQQAVQDLLGSGEILVVVRYVYGAGAREFFFFKEMAEFRTTITRLRRRDSVVVMKSFRDVIAGTVDAQFVEAAAELYRPGEDWVVIDYDAPKFMAKNYYASSKKGLLEELEQVRSHRVRIIQEPNYISAEHSIGAYIPDPDGVVRPGAY